MKNIRNTIIGIFIGVFLFGGISFAAEYVVKDNLFPIFVNGVKNDNIKALNIDGFTYIQLASLKEAGLTVKFNETDKQIEVTSSQPTAEVATEATKGDDTVSGFRLNRYGLPDFSRIPDRLKPKLEDNGEYTYFTYEGAKYVYLGKNKEDEFIVPSHYGFRYHYIESSEGNTFDRLVVRLMKFSQSEPQIIIDEVPYASYSSFPDEKQYITYDYYINTLLPAIKEGAE